MSNRRGLQPASVESCDRFGPARGRSRLPSCDAGLRGRRLYQLRTFIVRKKLDLDHSDRCRYSKGRRCSMLAAVKADDQASHYREARPYPYAIQSICADIPP